MTNVEDRMQILEGLVGRLLYEVNQLREEQRQIPHPLAVSAPPPSPEPTLTTGHELGRPQPHPEWLAVLHLNGSSPCGQPGVFLTQRVSGVHRASPDVVRILPMTWDAKGGYWITEPYRAPISSDTVHCASCSQPVELWTSRDLDYQPWLDNEIGQPMYPKLVPHQVPPPTSEMLENFRQSGFRDEDQLAKLKEQAQLLREQASAAYAERSRLPPLPAYGVMAAE